MRHVLRLAICGIGLMVTALGFSPMGYAEGENDPLWSRPRYEKKVMQIGSRILQANQITEHITFRVVQHQSVNAIENGRHGDVAVYTGLLKIVENDDELAFVISHEIGHILKKHLLKRSITRTVLGTTLGMAAGLWLGDGDIDATTWYGQRVENMVTTPIVYFSNGFELEADAQGIDLMTKAGYNPWAGYRMIEKISGDGYLWRFLRSHPNGQTRLTHIERQIQAKYRNSERYPDVSQPLADPAAQPTALPVYFQD